MQRRPLKVVCCVVGDSRVDAAVVQDAMCLPSSSSVDVDVHLNKDPLTSLAVASKAVVSAGRAEWQKATTGTPGAGIGDTDSTVRLGASSEVVDNTCVVTGRLSPRYMLLSTVPCRSLVEVGLDALRAQRHPQGSAFRGGGGGGSGSSSTVLMLGVFVFPREHLESPLSLAPNLARTAGLLDAAVSQTQQGSRTLDSYLPADALLFGRPRLMHGAFVEVRTLVEYDALVDALFSSSTFQKILPLCSVQMVVAFHRVTVPQQQHSAPPSQHATITTTATTATPLVLHSMWFLHQKHLEGYCSTRTTSQPTVARQCVAHLGLPEDSLVRMRAPRHAALVVVAHSLDEVLAQSSFVQALILGCSASVSKYYPSPEPRPQALFGPPPPASRTAEGSITERRSLSHEAAMFLASVDANPQPGGSRPSTGVAAEQNQPPPSPLSVLKVAARSLEREYDAAEMSFDAALRTRDAERRALERSVEEQNRYRQTLETLDSALKEGDERRKTITLELHSMRQEMERCRAAVAQEAESSAAYAAAREVAAAAAEKNRSEVLQKQRQEVADFVTDAGRRRAELDRQREAAVARRKLEDERTRSEAERALHAAQSNWERKETQLTALMATQSELEASLAAASVEVQQKSEQAAASEQRLRRQAAALGVELSQLTDASVDVVMAAAEKHWESMSMELVRLRGELRDKKRATEACVAQQQRQERELAEMQLRECEARAAAEQDRARAREVEPSLWADMRVFLTELETAHRASLDSDERMGRSALSRAEADSWVKALDASERRLLDESKRRCRETVLRGGTELRVLEQHQEAAASTVQALREQLHSTEAKHQALRRDVNAHLERIEWQERTLTAYLRGEPIPPIPSPEDEKAVDIVDGQPQSVDGDRLVSSRGAAVFPSLEEDFRRLSESVERVRRALATAVVVRGSEPVEKRRKQASIAAQQLRGFRAQVSEVLRALEDLHEAAREQHDASLTALSAAEEALAASEVTRDERREILSSAVAQTAAAEKGIQAVSTAVTALGEAIVDKKRRHEQLRTQMQQEFLVARDAATRQNVEGHLHLKRLEEESNEAMARLGTLQHELVALQAEKESLTSAAAAHDGRQQAVITLQLQLQREAARQEELALAISAEEKALAEAAEMARRSGATTCLPPGNDTSVTPAVTGTANSRLMSPARVRIGLPPHALLSPTRGD